MENQLTVRKILVIAAVLLLLVVFGLGGFLAGRLVQIQVYKQNIEQIADINPCQI